jgi:hypothetical protein
MVFAVSCKKVKNVFPKSSPLRGNFFRIIHRYKKFFIPSCKGIKKYHRHLTPEKTALFLKHLKRTPL